MIAHTIFHADASIPNIRFAWLRSQTAKESVVVAKKFCMIIGCDPSQLLGPVSQRPTTVR